MTRSTAKCALLFVATVFGVVGCRGFSKPAPFDDAFVRERAVTVSGDGMRASAALLSREEICGIFGVDLARKRIQPVWIEIENGTDAPAYFLCTGLDPEYYPPREVGYAFRSTFSGAGNRRLDEHLSGLCLDYRAPIAPGSSASGFVYTHEDDYAKVIHIDLLQDDGTTTLTMSITEPGDAEAAGQVAAFEAPIPADEVLRIDDAAGLREAIEGLPCCALGGDGEHAAPLNFVLVGAFRDWLGASRRRDYRRTDAAPLYAFDRAQDGTSAKRAKWIDAAPHVVRSWRTRLQYRGEDVWLGQVSLPHGGRFARDSRSLDPAVDDARDSFVEDVLYSQHVGRIGFAKGAGCAKCEAGGVRTDGLRVVLVHTTDPTGLDEIDFFEWERLADPR